MSTAPKHTNRLAKETSPYLLQHAHNPVDWYPWGEPAFEKARQENKPVFLSVGYSACHWCHVMERESFEDEEVAKLLNERFVCIKVDREERPDVDDIYMKYVHLTKQRGGWPMSVVMTPQGAPWFGGTYYPKPAFMQLLRQLSEAWKNDRARIQAHATQVVEVLKHEAHAHYKPPQRSLSENSSLRMVDQFEEFFDFENGGMMGRMKFPPHQTLEMLTELVDDGKEAERARKMLALTLDRMQLGGIHDHLGGGFHRYATDQVWLLPHFEKMLYDNAQLARVYARAAAVLRNEDYARTARGIYDWVLRDLSSPDGVFYSAYDADSEGEEGKFYVWEKAEVDALLGDDAKLFCSVYNLRDAGNYREEATGHPTGLNIPHLTQSLAEHAAELKMEEPALREKLAACRARLLEVRRKRVWPGLDDKVLTSWNALMLGSLAVGGKFLHEPKYVQAAAKAADWLLKHHRTPDGRWLATSRKGDARLAAYLDDHAYLACAFLDLHEATGEARWKDEAAALVKLLDAHFRDEQGGGYFFVADDHETLIVRVKNPNDNATPSGNGMAAQALVRLAKLSGEESYRKRAEELFRAFHTLLDMAPVQVESMLKGLHLYYEYGYVLEQTAPAAAPKAAPRKQAGPVIAELVLENRQVRPGDVAPLAVRLALDEGWHIQAHEPSQPAFIATAIKLASKDLGTLEKVKYPEATELDAPKLGGKLKVYSGKVEIRAALQIAANAKLGPQPLQVEVTFQACNDRICDAPQTLVLELEVEVMAP